MDDIRTDTGTFTLVQIVEGDPPAIIVRKFGVDVQGNRRPIERQIPVRDAALFAQIVAEAAPGDTVEITKQTNWSQSGLPKEVVAFKNLSCTQTPEPTAPAERVA